MISVTWLEVAADTRALELRSIVSPSTWTAMTVFAAMKRAGHRNVRLWHKGQLWCS